MGLCQLDYLNLKELTRGTPPPRWRRDRENLAASLGSNHSLLQLGVQIIVVLDLAFNHNNLPGTSMETAVAAAAAAAALAPTRTEGATTLRSHLDLLLTGVLLQCHN